MNLFNSLRGLGLGILALSVTGLAIASQEPKSAAPSSKPADTNAAATSEAAASPSGSAAYVGSETCQACHEDIFKSFQRNRHHAVEAGTSKWNGKACESCHGPGGKHVESASAADILNPTKMRPMESERTCLACHKNTSAHSGRIQGGHGRNQVACVSCHSMHKPGADAITTGRNNAINSLCAGCHTQTWAEFQKPHKHLLPEGAMSCVDCHNPHGSILPRMIDTVNANERSCIRCHSEMRGPFTYEHPVVKMEGCRACHESHGSANPRMLTRHEVRFVCLECHANLGFSSAQTHTVGGVPPSFHNLNSPTFRNCTVCHMKVHGSYVDRGLTR